SYGLELLATVYWTIVKEAQSDFKDVQEYIYQWNDRKKQFTSKQIKLAQEHLNELGWLPF
ncbi:MAG: Appr-1-p processing protein, partial [Alcaligenaceae bacterium]|nr:Appr-1-p processing protein [Alcaligenaceae bacterium]